MKKKYYIVLNKNGHYFLEIFIENPKGEGAMRSIKPMVSQFESEKEISDRTFNFKCWFDLKHNHPLNETLKTEYGEDRIFFLSSLEAINTFNYLYDKLKHSHIHSVLEMERKIGVIQ